MVKFPEKQFKRLTEAIEWSENQLQTPRRKRIEAVKEFVGFHYSDEGAAKKVPVNLLKLAVKIYVQLLAPRAPRALFSAVDPALKPTAANLELAINQIPKEIGLAGTLRRVATEALFSMGILKVGLHRVGEILEHAYGAPFVDVVTLDDYVVDMSAKRREQIQFEGNGYWLTRKAIEDSDWFDKKAKSDLTDDDGEQEVVIGEHGESRAEGISVGSTNVTSYQKRVWLRDIWVPSDGVLITYAVRNKKILKVVDYERDSRGPYYILGFDDVPGNLLPLPPVAIWRDLHELANALFRKLGTQADDQKRVLGFTGNDSEGVENFKNARDSDGIRFSGGKPEKLEAGGVDAKTLAFFMQVRDLASYFGGNLDSLGGLAPMTETLGQDRLLTEAAGAQLRDMQGEMIKVAREVFRALAWYEWHDPVKTRTLEKPLPGLPGVSIPVEWSRDSRQGDFDEFDLDIDVYSLLDDSPALKLQRLGLVMQQYVLPLMPAIEAQGGSLDANRLLKLVAKLSDFSELDDIVTFPVTDTQQAGGSQRPAETKRTYERISRPGATPHGKSDAMQRVLMGENLQDDEAAVLGG